MNKSIYIATGVFVAALLYILSGQFGSKETKKESLEAAIHNAPQVKIETQLMNAQNMDATLTVRGKTVANREVMLRAETESSVDEILVQRGAFVKKGDVIARLTAQDRRAQLAQKQAVLKQRDMEFNAARTLSEKGFRAETKLAEAQANLETARADLKKAELDLNNIYIRAPFDGFLEDRMVEVGDYVKVGDDVARVVDLDPIYMIGGVTEQDIHQVTRGQKAQGNMLNGDKHEGVLHYVAATADTDTRTFRVELSVPNKDGSIPVGVTSDILIPVGAKQAHCFSPAILSLRKDGQVGVKVVDDQRTVHFFVVSIISRDDKGVCVTGLPAMANVIIKGQEFVQDGDIVPAEVTQ